VKGDRPSLHHNRYEIEPFSAGARSTHWVSTNPAVGALRGRFVLAGDAILSFYASPTGRYRGFECLQQRDANRYSAQIALRPRQRCGQGRKEISFYEGSPRVKPPGAGFWFTVFVSFLFLQAAFALVGPVHS